MLPLTDKSPMPWGKHKGTILSDVPARYLMYLYDAGNNDPQISKYLIRNLEAIRDRVVSEKDWISVKARVPKVHELVTVRYQVGDEVFSFMDEAGFVVEGRKFGGEEQNKRAMYWKPLK